MLPPKFDYCGRQTGGCSRSRPKRTRSQPRETSQTPARLCLIRIYPALLPQSSTWCQPRNARENEVEADFLPDEPGLFGGTDNKGTKLQSAVDDYLLSHGLAGPFLLQWTLQWEVQPITNTLKYCTSLPVPSHLQGLQVYMLSQHTQTQLRIRSSGQLQECPEEVSLVGTVRVKKISFRDLPHHKPKSTSDTREGRQRSYPHVASMHRCVTVHFFQTKSR